MKHLRTSIILAALLITAIAPGAFAKGNKNEENPTAKKILILGLKNNIKSDYYYNGLIAEESGIPEDSLELTFNRIIANNIALSRIDFIPIQNNGKCGSVVNNIKVKGEQEDCISDLSEVDNQSFHDLLSNAGAEYVLILNRHFIKKQEQPFNTLFYIVSYSLYNKEKQEISNGSSYFTAMHIESAEIMKKASRKSSDKIASIILKLVAQQPAESPSLLLSKN